MVKYLKIAKNIIYYLAIVLLVLVSLATASTVLDIPKGTKFLMVQSGSMEPSIKTGSIVVINKASEYKEGDIVTYQVGNNLGLRNPSNIITHRIFKIEDNGSIITKGDANDTPDSVNVTKNQIIGKVRLSLPFLGYAVSFAKSQTGFILLIIVPGTLIIYGELMNIKLEIVKIIDEYKKKKKVKKKVKKKNKNKTFLKELLVFFLFASCSLYFSSTKAYLDDWEENKENIISAGVWGEEDLELFLNEPLIILQNEIIQTDPLESEENNPTIVDTLLFETGEELVTNQSVEEEIFDFLDIDVIKNE